MYFYFSDHENNINLEHSTLKVGCAKSQNALITKKYIDFVIH